ncbi:phd zinc finger-containing protein-related [Anaeramoeba flamelloides]|uniref:Phd zinc finger-containing protein-related n=1 Tax=Anaeramoeba flamelloides TaxID=1746091 RepID=A0AAV8AB19_9EUKA|nr:phd zinc finger-containing protein-related [Anaeramoeba flamelloides]
MNATKLQSNTHKTQKQKGHDSKKDTRRRVTRSTKNHRIIEEPKKNLGQIGIFHYSDATLRGLFEITPKNTIYNHSYQFYVPSSAVSYSHKKVVDRCIWVANKNRYSINSDLIPVIIHSSTYVPDFENKAKAEPPLGMVVAFQYIDSNAPKFLMRRKNGIRSRYCSKSFDKVVEIVDVQIVQNKSQLPKPFLKLTEYSKKYHKAQITHSKKKCHSKSLRVGSNNKRKRRYPTRVLSKKSKKKIIVKKRIKKNGMKNTKVLSANQQTQQQEQEQKQEQKQEQQTKTLKKNSLPKQKKDPMKNNIHDLNIEVKSSLPKEEFSIAGRENKEIFSESFSKPHFDFFLKESSETTYLQDTIQEFLNSLKYSKLDYHENLVPPLEQPQLNFNNCYLSSYKNEGIFDDDHFTFNYEYDNNFLF